VKIAKYSVLFLLLFSSLVAAFPSVPIVEQCNRTEDPIAGIWTNGVEGTGACQCNGTVLIGTSGTNDCYITQTFGGVQELYVTYPNMASHNPDTNYHAFMCLQGGLGAATVDGYGWRVRRVTAASDIIQMFRLTDATPTYIGTAYQSIEFANNDAVGMRIEPGGTLRLYFNDGGAGWSEVDTITGETTYNCNNTNIGVDGQHSTVHYEDIGAGSVGAPYTIIQAR